jgi:uncharacterized membrane protein (GlpM family)
MHARGSGIPTAPVKDLLTLLLKGLAGGGLVVAFALLCESVKPKRFAGLFGAAPAVALASLSIVLLTKTVHDAHENAIGMLAGCAGMAAYATVVVALLKRMGGRRASTYAMGAWVVVAGVVAVPLVI